MTKTLIVAALLSSFAAVSFAQGAASAADGASAPAKHAKAKKAHKMHHAASTAVDPEKSADKKGGQ
jgi:Ni/Co efflux regulator RcnB